MKPVKVKFKSSGFTLIELMIAVAIIGILASIAIPSYQAHVDRTRRADAQATLTAAANAMERYKTGGGQGSYLSASFGSASTDVFPAEAPLEGNAKYYKLSLLNLAANTYTILAEPKGAMVGDGRLTITHTGRRCWYKDQDSSGGTCTPF